MKRKINMPGMAKMLKKNSLFECLRETSSEAFTHPTVDPMVFRIAHTGRTNKIAKYRNKKSNRVNIAIVKIMPT